MKNNSHYGKNYSTTLAICNTYDGILNKMDQGQKSCYFFLELSKAFDIVNHSILLQELEDFYEFRGLA